MSLAMASKASQMRASTVPLRSPSSMRKYCFPSRVLRISFSWTRKKEVMLCSVASSVTKDFFIWAVSKLLHPKLADFLAPPGPVDPLGRWRGGGSGRGAGRRSVARALAEEAEFLMAFFCFDHLGRGADFLNFGVTAAGNVLIAGLDDHVTLRA